MSLARLTQMAAQGGRSAPEHDPAPLGAPPGGPPPPPGQAGVVAGGAHPADAHVGGALSIVSDYIPSEILTMYIAIIGLVQTAGATWLMKWSVFAGALAVLLAYVVISFLQQRLDHVHHRGPAASVWHYSWVAGMASVAFTAYAMSIPGNPFEEITRQLTILGGALGLGLAVLMPMLGRLVGVQAQAS